jgi:hypothetical protein
MEELKKSASLEICTIGKEAPITLLFSAKNIIRFETHTFLINRNFEKEEFDGTYMIGYYFNLNNNLNLKEFKIEVSK